MIESFRRNGIRVKKKIRKKAVQYMLNVDVNWKQSKIRTDRGHQSESGKVHDIVQERMRTYKVV